jgi:hypothetical protein
VSGAIPTGTDVTVRLADGQVTSAVVLRAYDDGVNVVTYDVRTLDLQHHYGLSADRVVHGAAPTLWERRLADFPVKVLRTPQERSGAASLATCGTCGRSWDDAIPTSWTPAPSARCPFEYWH